MDMVTYALLKKQMASSVPGYTYKGSVATASALPSGASVGDLYTVTGENGAQYVWDGSSWVSASYPTITNAQIDALFE